MTQGERGKRNAEMIRLYKQGKGYRDIAAMFGMSFQNVQQTIRKYGVESHPAGRKKTVFVFSDYVSIIGEMREVGRGITYLSRLIGIYNSHPQWEEFVAYVKSFPKYGGIKNRRCSRCGIIGGEALFYKQGGYCKSCQNQYYADRKRV